jgi:hypothetical protein
MNERIFELAKQADLIQWDTLPSGARTPDHESVVKVRKFAELIINECTQVLFAEAERLNGLSSEETNLAISDDLESCAEKCMDNIVRIEEHFGVAE